MSEFEINGFKIIEKIGEGGMATVWKANQQSLDRLVAIKVLSPKLAANKEDIEMFRQEAQSAAKLKHSGIIQVYDARTENGLYCLVMEFIDGYTVGDWLRRKTILEENNAILICESVAMALEYAWDAQKIIHCDIKPDNIMIDADGTVKLADLGLSRTISNLDAAQDLEEVMGTPAYMSPEQVQGEVNIDCRSDIYSLGAMLFHLVTGKMLFEGYSEEQVMEMQLYEIPPAAKSINPQVSQELSDLIAMMLQKDPDKRPSGWRDVLNKLHKIKNGKKGQSKKIVTDPSLKRKVKPQQKVISIKHKQASVASSNISHTLSEPEKPKSATGVIVTIAIIMIITIVGATAMSHASKLKKQQAAQQRAQIAYKAKLNKEAKEYNAILNYHNQNPLKYAYVISKLKNFQKSAKIDKYKSLASDKISILEKQYKKAVENAIQLMDRQAEKYVDQGDLFKAQFIYSGYNGDFTKETQKYRDLKTQELQTLIDKRNERNQEKEKIKLSVRKVVANTFKKMMQNSPALALAYLKKQIQTDPSLTNNYTVKTTLDMLYDMDTKTVIKGVYSSIRESGESITISTQNRVLYARVKSVEDDGLHLRIINSDGIANSEAFVPFSQLAPSEIQKRLKENMQAYQLKKGMEYLLNNDYEMAYIYLQPLPENYVKLLTGVTRKNEQKNFNESAEEDLLKILRSHNVEVYKIEDLNTTTWTDFTPEQLQNIKNSVNKWEEAYQGHKLNVSSWLPFINM